MNDYLLSVVQPDGPIPSPEVLAGIAADLRALHEEIHQAGAWVFACGLEAASRATVVRIDGDQAITTDGPFAEGKEHVGGFLIIKAPDIGGALAWAGKAARATTLPIEVRALQQG
jgi:hypothetical protein